MNADSIIDEITQLFNNLYVEFIHLIPKIILALVVLIIGLGLGWIVKRMIIKFIFFLDRNINDRLRKRLISVNLGNSADFIGKMFFWTIQFISIAIITHILGIPLLMVWLGGLVTYVPNIFAAVIIVFAGIIAGKLVGDLIGSAAIRTGFVTGKRLGLFVQYNILFISIIIAIDQIGIDIQFLTIILTIILASLLFGAALAFGLGAQSSIGNILGAYYLNKVYREGNTIQIGEIVGIIVKITPTAVFLETETGQVMIPAKHFNDEKTILIKND